MRPSREVREARLKALNSLYIRYGTGFLDTDPISIPRSHAAPE